MGRQIMGDTPAFSTGHTIYDLSLVCYSFLSSPPLNPMLNTATLPTRPAENELEHQRFLAWLLHKKEERGWSFRQLAKFTRLSRMTLSGWFKSNCTVSRRTTRARIRRLLADQTADGDGYWRLTATSKPGHLRSLIDRLLLVGHSLSTGLMMWRGLDTTLIVD